MTPRPIRVLPESLVGRIASGEVVERPASAVKELVENALDAGAEAITVEVEGGPAGLLRVTDDGTGIPAAELGTAVQRHATSKIDGPDDLDAVPTLGFRGEGLAAIGAVSRMRVLSRTEDGETAAQVVVEDGRVAAGEPAARARGTTVEVRDLFFTTPARRKYLKSPSTERRAVARLVQAYAFGNPKVAFTLVQEGKEALRAGPAADLHERAVQILGAGRVARMIPVLVEEPGVGIEGFLGAPEEARAQTGHQVFLINGRWVASPVLRQCVRAAYGDLIPPARHPEALLLLTLPPGEVDVNVHPTKREVRLLRERELYPRLITLLRRRVEGHFPSLRLREPDQPLPPELEPERGYAGEDRGGQQKMGLFPASPGADRVGWVSDSPRREGLVVPFPTAADVGGEAKGESGTALANLWQIHDTYILARIKSGVLVIDQHAAHERVLYEQALRRFEGEPPASQELLFPLVVELTPDELPLLLEAHAHLEKLGFHLELFGGTSVLVHAIPAGVREWSNGALLRDILDHFGELPDTVEIHEKVARSVACHGAVKAGQTLSLAEMNELVDQLFATEKPQGDPHGRPVFLRIDLAELHRRFGRSG